MTLIKRFVRVYARAERSEPMIEHCFTIGDGVHMLLLCMMQVGLSFLLPTFFQFSVLSRLRVELTRLLNPV